MAIPLFGRLSLGDYKRLILTILVLVIEEVVRVAVIIGSFFSLPFNTTTIYNRSKYLHRLLPKFLLNRWKESASPDYQSKTVHPIAMFQHATDMAAFWGYKLDEFAVETKDGYWLGIHRLRKPENDAKIKRPVVLLWHGFMMSSEVWLAHPEGPKSNLSMHLVEAGYDVWLGNVRGNKYSHKHSFLKPTQSKFWDFSLDEHALVDLPTTVDFILKTTGAKSLSYVGFSQGTTISFAALSLVPELRNKINLFVALAPSMKPYGLTNSLIATCVRTSPELLYMIFGRKSLLPSVYFYQSVMSPFFFCSVIDTAMNVLFNWRSNNMSVMTKSAAYQHLYSLCSVKVMIHWFQIIQEGRFQVFNEERSVKKAIPYEDIVFSDIVSSNDKQEVARRASEPYITLEDGKAPPTFLVGIDPEIAKKRNRKPSSSGVPFGPRPIISHYPTRFPTEQIAYDSKESEGIPIAVFYGGSDGLLDMQGLLAGLRFPWSKAKFPQKHHRDKGFVIFDKTSNTETADDSPLVFLKCVPHYEHLCFLWADSTNKEVFPDVERLLEQYCEK